MSGEDNGKRVTDKAGGRAGRPRISTIADPMYGPQEENGMIATEGTDRLSPRIAHARKCLADRVRLDGAGPLPATLDLAEFERTLDNTLSDHFAFQTAQSRAFATGKLSMYEAQIIYIALGERPGASGWAAGTDLATKLIVTQVLAEIVRGQVGSR